MKTPAGELAERQAKEKAKAVQKYGDDALLPAGRPDLDVHDYAVNELVGMIRYAEMLINRYQMMRREMTGLGPEQVVAIRNAEEWARELFVEMNYAALKAIRLRQTLRKSGLMLGAGE
jgi:hypothetical protein